MALVTLKLHIPCTYFTEFIHDSCFIVFTKSFIYLYQQLQTPLHWGPQGQEVNSTTIHLCTSHVLEQNLASSSSIFSASLLLHCELMLCCLSEHATAGPNSCLLSHCLHNHTSPGHSPRRAGSSQRHVSSNLYLWCCGGTTSLAHASFRL